MADWLALAAPAPLDNDAWLDAGVVQADATALTEANSSAPVPGTDVVMPETSALRNAKFIEVWGTLTSKQHAVLRALQERSFNVARTLRDLGPLGCVPHTYYRWTNNDESFAFALKVLKIAARERVMDQDRIHLRLDEIAEGALEPKETMFKGGPTGIYEKNYAASLKATELQMKAGKMLGEEKQDAFGGRAITLAVQVVLPSGEVREATRQGVVIDVPVIEVDSEG